MAVKAKTSAAWAAAFAIPRSLALAQSGF